MNDEAVMEPRYPEVHVTLLGENGNAGAIIGRVTRALKRQARISEAECNEFRLQAMSGNYDNLLRTVMAWVSTDDEDHPNYGE